MGQKQLVEQWEHHMKQAVYAGHIILIAGIAFSAALYLKSPTDATSLFAYQSIPTIVCCVLLLLFGIVIIYICLAYFVALLIEGLRLHIFVHWLLFSMAMPNTNVATR